MSARIGTRIDLVGEKSEGAGEVAITERAISGRRNMWEEGGNMGWGRQSFFETTLSGWNKSTVDAVHSRERTTAVVCGDTLRPLERLMGHDNV